MKTAQDAKTLTPEARARIEKALFKLGISLKALESYCRAADAQETKKTK